MTRSMHYTCTGRYRDLRRCLKSLDSFTDGQACILDWDTEKLEFVRLQITPKDGLYKGGHFNFEVRFTNAYPETSPTVTCLSNVYHPNIDPLTDSDNVCLNLISEWQNTFGLDDVIQGLLFLFYNPNQDDALAPFFSGEEEKDYEEKVKKTLQGEELEEYRPSTWKEVVLSVPLPTELLDVGELLELVDSQLDEQGKDLVVGDCIQDQEEKNETSKKHAYHDTGECTGEVKNS